VGQKPAGVRPGRKRMKKASKRSDLA